jgi:tetratricopeptide (TPR) repeat protein
MTVSELPAGYANIPEEDRRKARAFFDRGKTVADTGNYEFAIEMYILGLTIDPEELEAHKALHDISLKRKASGGKPMGFLERRKFSTVSKDDKQNLVNFEKLLSYDPGNTDYLVQILQNAHRGGFLDTVMWVGPILQRANADSKSPDLNKFIILKDIYKQLGEWKLATDACHYALKMKPNDMGLQTELKNLGAQHTMSKGGYGKAKSFRESMRDANLQNKLMEQDKDVQSVDHLLRAVNEAELEWRGDPQDPGKLNKYIEALRRTEVLEQEERAVEVLEQMYQTSGQFRHRQKVGEIRMAQMARMERSLRAEVAANPTDVEVQQTLQQFVTERAQAELEEYRLIVDAYPTDSTARYQMGRRLFDLKRFQEAIPVFQQVRSDPKFRMHAALLLGRCFLEAGFVDEAVETLKVIIDEYPTKGDERSRELYYWYARALEEHKEFQSALKAYSQVAQWDFNYRDVQGRIKRLRAAAAAAT